MFICSWAEEKGTFLYILQITQNYAIVLTSEISLSRLVETIMYDLWNKNSHDYIFQVKTLSFDSMFEARRIVMVSNSLDWFCLSFLNYQPRV